MKRERTLQVVLALVGLFYVALIYPLYTDLWHSKWLLELKNETEPMFLSFYVALGPFLLLAARKPSSHRSLIAFAAWSSLAHASVMTIQTVEAWNHGIHRDFYGCGAFWRHRRRFAGALAGKTRGSGDRRTLNARNKLLHDNWR